MTKAAQTVVELRPRDGGPAASDHVEPVAETPTNPTTGSSTKAAPHGFGPWGGRRLLYARDEALEALTNQDLQVILLDLLVSVARSKADREGRVLDRRGELARAANVDVMAAQKPAVVAANIAAVRRALKAMASARPPIEIGFTAVAEWLAANGSGLHRATLHRRPEYANPILKAMGRPLRDSVAVEAAADPEYPRVAHLTKPELVEEIRRERRKLKTAERQLADFLADLA